uniref:Formiminotransferase N-terminal subdomain domain-containing protein n=1 Tax=Setaria viridis TaxID=4556 RepID=A0A4V6D0Z7_SETVI|nr:hypothetical protein SEVIR_9G178800v2 [Setaria viridis]
MEPHSNKVPSSPPALRANDNLSMMHSKFICCKLYISESLNAMAIDAIDCAARSDLQVAVLSKFEDCLYNRVRYTLVSYIVNDSSTGEVIYSPIRKVLFAMMEAAFSAINLNLHSGAHPRMGVNDDLSFHPLGQSAMEDAVSLAKQVASDTGNDFRVPVLLYAAAHPASKSVGAIRRELGYYRPNYMGSQWSVVRRITRSVSGRGGGLPSVQALALSMVIAQRLHACWIRIMSVPIKFRQWWSRLQQTKDLMLRRGTSR